MINPPQFIVDNFDIDEQIESIQKEVAEFTQKLFEARGMLRLALHLKAQQEKKIAASSPA